MGYNKLEEVPNKRVEVKEWECVYYSFYLKIKSYIIMNGCKGVYK